MKLSIENLLSCDGELYLYKGFYSKAIADQHFANVLGSLEWQHEKIYLYGRWVQVPRLMAWYGDAEAVYQYSRVVHQPKPWTPRLLEIRKDLEDFSAMSFNSVLANLYRDGTDSMGCHADNEKELGANPTIASLSFGDSRILRFKHQANREHLDVLLEHGDLLWMSGAIQQHWQHELPKTRKPKQARINLTFRKINPDWMLFSKFEKAE